MARRGRKLTPGKRYPGGKRKPAPIAYDRGSEWVQAQRARYGEHYSSALGRAYAAGLLGEGNDAKRLYDGGKAFVRAYRRIYGGEGYRCPLNDDPRSTGFEMANSGILDDDRRCRDWLRAVSDSLDVAGVRPWLDQLIHSLYVDAGPPWLDRLLAGGKDSADRMFLDAALQALDIIAPAKRSIHRAA